MARCKVTHIKQKKTCFHQVKSRGYNTQFLLHYYSFLHLYLQFF